MSSMILTADNARIPPARKAGRLSPSAAGRPLPVKA